MSTHKIANFVVETGYDHIPQKAITIAKECILDCLGVALAGSKEPMSMMITNYIREQGGKPEAGVIAGGFRTSPPQAALANGTLAHALDYDDSQPSFQHGTAVTLPAVLALAERERISGQAALEAYILGCEVGSKIGAQMSTRLLELGWHACAIVGSLAAAVAAAKILKLNELQIRRALGIAASQASGLRRNFGTDTKPFHAGNAAKNGVVAALLAAKGFSADENILEGAGGLLEVFVGKEYDPVQVAAELGSPFSMVSRGVRIKPYPACGTTHKSITAMLELIKEHPIPAEEVAEVECKVARYIKDVLCYSQPKTGLEGKFSMHYCMAAILLDGEVTLGQFTDEKVRSPKAQDLIARVKWVELETREVADPIELPQIVTVKLRDGTQYSHQVPFAKGEAHNPLSREEVELKFRDCAGSVLSPYNLERTVELVSKLESLEDVSELAHILTTNRKGR